MFKNTRKQFLYVTLQEKVNAINILGKYAYCAGGSIARNSGAVNKKLTIQRECVKAIPHNSKCRYGERGTAAAKPKAQIILDAAKVSAASGGNSEPKQGQRSQSARGFCLRSTMRVPQPDIIEHFGNADAVPQPPERCLSRQAGIVRCCLNIVIPFWLLSPLFISSRSSPPSRTGWRRSCRCRWPPWPGTMPRTAPPDGNIPQHLPRSWNTFALGWGMPFADFTHTNNKHRAAMQGVLLLAARCFVVSGYCRVIVSFWQAVCPRPTANPMRRRQGRGTRSDRTAGTRRG